MQPQSYRKKPVVIKAIRVPVLRPGRDGHETFHYIEDRRAIAHWCNGRDVMEENGGGFIIIQTLKGTMIADPGDWIIEGIKGEFYPCKPDIFEATYEAA